MMDFKRKAIERTLEGYLSCTNTPPYQRLLDAMKYSVLNGGKRLRAILLLEFVHALGGDMAKALPCACAIEMIHAASLIHDDLPCMDDDDLRRGKPSCHKAYGEDIAVLAGDALIVEAFNTIANNTFLSAEKTVKVLRCLGKAVGVQGIMGGQAMDLQNDRSDASITVERLDMTNGLKTGALISAACEIGCIIANATNSQIIGARQYASNIGAAFQVVDDILDIIGTEAELGKPIGSDAAQNKTTYATIYGIERCQLLVAELVDNAKLSLESAGIHSENLRNIADYIANRNK